MEHDIRVTFCGVNAMSLLKQITINHAHPTKLLFDLIGLIWTVYFLWENNFWLGLAIGVSSSVLGTLLTIRANSEQIAKTVLGKYMLARLHPFNFVFQLSGYLVSLYGIWFHSGWVILTGVTLVILGHLWGWSQKVIP